MTRRVKATVAAIGAAALMAGGASAALGASAESQCEAAGGTFTKSGGTSTCTFPVGNSDNTKVTDQKGSFNSSHDETLTNPGGTQPPGQQGGNDIGNQ
jgi:hypothetical protein